MSRGHDLLQQFRKSEFRKAVYSRKKFNVLIFELKNLSCPILQTGTPSITFFLKKSAHIQKVSLIVYEFVTQNLFTWIHV